MYVYNLEIRYLEICYHNILTSGGPTLKHLREIASLCPGLDTSPTCRWRHHYHHHRHYHHSHHHHHHQHHHHHYHPHHHHHYHGNYGHHNFYYFNHWCLLLTLYYTCHNFSHVESTVYIFTNTENRYLQISHWYQFRRFAVSAPKGFQWISIQSWWLPSSKRKKHRFWFYVSECTRWQSLGRGNGGIMQDTVGSCNLKPIKKDFYCADISPAHKTQDNEEMYIPPPPAAPSLHKYYRDVCKSKFLPMHEELDSHSTV